jgi:serine phosphatase RsbU (regulator of sigma subunit)
MLFWLFAASLPVLTLLSFSLFAAPGFSLTLLHLPVIVGALLLGYRRGIALGALFGLCSLFRAILLPLTPMDSLFADPLVAVPPRMGIGLIALFVYRLASRLPGDDTPARRAFCTGLAAAAGSLANAAGVLVMVALLHPASLGLGRPGSLLALADSIGVNVLLEMILAVLAAVVCVPRLESLLASRFGHRLGDAIQIRLFYLVALVFLVAFGITSALQTRHARENANAVLSNGLRYLQKLIDENNEQLQLIEEDAGEILLTSARAVALLVRENPDLARDPDGLRQIREKLGLAEITLSDARGLVVASEPYKEEVDSVSFFSHAETALYGRLISDPDAVIVEKPRLRLGKGAISLYRQFVGVPRLDEPGIVQVALSSRRYAEAAEDASMPSLSHEFAVGRTGYTVVCRNGVIISAYYPYWEGKKVADYGIAEESLSGEGGSFTASVNGEQVLVRSQRYKEYTLVALLPEAEVYADRNYLVAWGSAMYFLLFAAVFIAIAVLLRAMVIRSIQQANASLALITAGDLEKKVDVRASYEFSLLSEGINAMVSALKEAIAKEATRIDRELGFARKIQTSTLNTVFPPYPDRPEFGLYAAMHTAREVGGDFYDFFFVDADHLVLVVADVSDKGIPAALFMMTAKTRIKSAMLLQKPLGATMAEVNARLCEGNDANMFVTVFIAVLDVRSGLLRFVNAGHNPPLLRREGGAFDWLRVEPSPAMGALEGLVYPEFSLRLSRGDRLFCYTDGVTEAADARKRFFGERRLLETLNAHADDSLEDLLLAVKQAIDLFAGKAFQYDDITMLGLDYNGSAD